MSISRCHSVSSLIRPANGDVLAGLPLGAFHSVWFTDPDGMRTELVLIVDPQLHDIHAPTPVTATRGREVIG